MNDPGLLTLTAAATRSGHTRAALRQRVRRGTLSAVKGNDGILRVRSEDIDGLPPSEATTDDHEQPEDPMVMAMDILRTNADELRDDRDRAVSSLDATRDELTAERLRAALAEERAGAAVAQAVAAEARLAAAEAALAEAHVPLVLRVIAALRRR